MLEDTRTIEDESVRRILADPKNTKLFAGGQTLADGARVDRITAIRLPSDIHVPEPVSNTEVSWRCHRGNLEELRSAVLKVMSGRNWWSGYPPGPSHGTSGDGLLLYVCDGKNSYAGYPRYLMTLGAQTVVSEDMRYETTLETDFPCDLLVPVTAERYQEVKGILGDQANTRHFASVADTLRDRAAIGMIFSIAIPGSEGVEPGMGGGGGGEIVWRCHRGDMVKIVECLKLLKVSQNWWDRYPGNGMEGNALLLYSCDTKNASAGYPRYLARLGVEPYTPPSAPMPPSAPLPHLPPPSSHGTPGCLVDVREVEELDVRSILSDPSNTRLFTGGNTLADRPTIQSIRSVILPKGVTPPSPVDWQGGKKGVIWRCHRCGMGELMESIGKICRNSSWWSSYPPGTAKGLDGDGLLLYICDGDASFAGYPRYVMRVGKSAAPQPKLQPQQPKHNPSVPHRVDSRIHSAESVVDDRGSSGMMHGLVSEVCIVSIQQAVSRLYGLRYRVFEEEEFTDMIYDKTELKKDMEVF